MLCIELAQFLGSPEKAGGLSLADLQQRNCFPIYEGEVSTIIRLG